MSHFDSLAISCLLIRVGGGVSCVGVCCTNSASVLKTMLLYGLCFVLHLSMIRREVSIVIIRLTSV